MIKVCKEKWAKNEEKLKEALQHDETLNRCDYVDLFKLAVANILNDDDSTDIYDIDKITVIDNGDYQGTLLFLIPTNDYQPSERDYLMAAAGYGSCSGCDTLQAIQMYDDTPPTESQLKDYLTLCRDLIASIIRPYNIGWRKDDRFDPCEE